MNNTYSYMPAEDMNNEIVNNANMNNGTMNNDMANSSMDHEKMNAHTEGPLSPSSSALPQHWPVSKKVIASLAASGYTFTLLYGATAYTTGLQGVMAEFNVSMTKAILPFSLYIWGIFFAPVYSPHVSEKFGRSIPYFVSTIGLAAFTLGAAYSQTYSQLCACRFFAGLLGGSSAVQIEGTFADVWPALYTGSYYPFIAAAQYFGAATGAIVGWHVVPSTSWRYSQYTTLMFCLAALLLGVGMPETYEREIIRRHARRRGLQHNLPPALSGTTIEAMAKLTILDPFLILVSQPIVLLITLYLALNFGVLFSWFISVPAVLSGVAGFTPSQIGSAFATALGGTAAAVVTNILIDQISVRILRKRSGNGDLDISHRIIPAIFGSLLLTASLFWIGWTANPMHQPYVPVVGNGFYVWGSAMTVIGFVGYLFDSYSPQATLSALTIAACTRLALAGIIPLVIIQDITNLGGMWALGSFGIISAFFVLFPLFIFFFGEKLRHKGKFGASHDEGALQMQFAESHRKPGEV